MIGRLIVLLDRDGGRLVLAGAALVALGVVTTLRTLAEAAGQWSDALPLGDRAVLGLYDAHPAHAVPFLVGAALVALGLRVRGVEAGPGAGTVAGVAWAYLGLGAFAAVVAVYTAATGSFGDGAAAVELTTRERTFGLAEQVVGNLAIAVASLAGARALLRGAEPAEVAGLDDETADEPGAAYDDAWPALGPPLAGPGGGNGRPPEPTLAEATAAADELVAEAPADEAPEAEPEPATPAERYRRLYDRRLRFSPRAGEARTLLARLRDDPDDEDTRDALERLAAPDD